MKKLASVLLLGFISFAPFSVAQAQNGALGGATLNEYLISIIGFINLVLVPLIFAIAFIVFIWGIFQYFIAGGANEEARDKGKQLAIWGIIAFVVMVSVWGIVNLFSATLNFGNKTTPDLPKFETSRTAPAS